MERLFYQYHNQLSRRPRYNIFINGSSPVYIDSPEYLYKWRKVPVEKEVAKDYYCEVCCLNVYHLKEYGSEEIYKPCFFCSTLNQKML